MSGTRRRILSTFLLLIVCSGTFAQKPASARFSGDSALALTGQAVALGARPSGSDAHRRLQQMIVAHLRSHRWEVLDDAFTGSTPAGPIAMRNIIARLKGKPGARAIAVTGHYDTKRMPGVRFVGANDGGSSTGFLLELARVLPSQVWSHDLYLVWFDGEEAVAEWTQTDSLYGSRHLAEKWQRDGTLRRLRALINVDMIGDRNLDIVDERTGTPWLRSLIWRVADLLGKGRHFRRDGGWIGDDHLPFLERGASAVDLIDFNYGENNEYWHTERDTMDKLSAASFQVVGDVVIGTLRRLEEDKL